MTVMVTVSIMKFCLNMIPIRMAQMLTLPLNLNFIQLISSRPSLVLILTILLMDLTLITLKQILDITTLVKMECIG